MENRSEEIKDLICALVKASAEMTLAEKNSKNPHFKSNYADLASFISAAREPLTNNGLWVVHTIKKMVVITTLYHTSGQWISSELEISPEIKTPQQVGSAITYYKRYALSALLCMASEDDDGQAASSAKRPATPEPVKPQEQCIGEEKAKILSDLIGDDLDYRQGIMRKYGSLASIPIAVYGNAYTAIKKHSDERLLKEMSLTEDPTPKASDIPTGNPPDFFK